ATASRTIRSELRSLLLGRIVSLPRLDSVSLVSRNDPYPAILPVFEWIRREVSEAVLISQLLVDSRERFGETLAIVDIEEAAACFDGQFLQCSVIAKTSHSTTAITAKAAPPSADRDRID